MSSPAVSTLHRRITTRLARRHETLACIEIGSDGHVSRSLTSEPGSSAFFTGSLILPADSARWPQSITGDGSWQEEPPGSYTRLAGLAGAAQAAFGADWGFAVECAPTASQVHVYVALSTPDGNAVSNTVLFVEGTVQPDAERLVECVLRLLAQRLEERTKELP